MDGNWNGDQLTEGTRQSELSKHRLLRVNTSATGVLNPGDASSYASVDPNLLIGLQSGAPHFILSSETPDNSHCYGFEFFLFDQAGTGGQFAIPSVGDYTVTPWILIGNAQVPNQQSGPFWVALAPQTGVGSMQLWHSFDVNACAIRFQITNVGTPGSIIIGLCEL